MTNLTKNDVSNHGDMTITKKAALVDALLFGDIWEKRPTGGWGARYHHIRTLNKLVAAGLLRYQSSYNESGGIYAGGYVLTDRGREIARTLDDTEDSASRQHYIDTGKYLPYGCREELNPPAFNVGEYIRNTVSKHESDFLIVGRQYVSEMQTWAYVVEVSTGPNIGTRFDQVYVNPKMYEVVVPKVERDWELLAPVAAQAATLVALGRGDEVVEDYSDGVITAWELLDELVKDGQ